MTLMINSCVSTLQTEKHLSDHRELSVVLTDLSSRAEESGSRGMTTTNKGNKALKVCDVSNESVSKSKFKA